MSVSTVSIEDCTNCVNPTKSVVVWVDFKRWINSRSWELREHCYTAAQKIFHDKLFGSIKPLVEMFTPKPPLTPEVEQQTKVTPHPETEIGIVYGKKLVVESEPIYLVMKTLEEFKQESEVVRYFMDKKEDMFKEQAQTNTKIEGFLQLILSRLPPPWKPNFFKCCFLLFSFLSFDYVSLSF